MRKVFLLICGGSLACFTYCSESSNESPLFTPLEAGATGIDFNNTLQYTEQLNPYTFKNFYNGGGVAIGDINNDGLADIFFCGNMVSNRLYLNLGDLQFKDITASANLESKDEWSTGVSMIDLNADGLLDIYVCKSGAPGGDRRHNLLYINNGDLTFTEQAKSYGLDHVGLSVHSTFFDFDKDGDLDCYLLNNSIKSIGSFEMKEGQRLIADSLGGNKLFRNDDGYFRDVSLESGIYSSEIGFGLGATAGDINSDGWPDMYISNDFFEKDYLYINQKNGTFKDQLEDYIKETSMGSMGADLADINNDGFPEYFVTEMLPEDRARMVTKTFFESWSEQKNAQNKGYYNQFGRNVLQLNNGDGTFSEIGRYAGVEATDWSWASLIFDIDNDGYKDIFVSNGIYKDLLDLDYLNFMNDQQRVRGIIQNNENAIELMIDMMPSQPVSNYVFRNNSDLTFTNMADEWGMPDPTFSNGSAYGDLDNDGDLDLAVNNINMPSVVYQNNASQLFPDRNFLALKLRGENANTHAIGAAVRIYLPGQVIYQELNPIRGFESSVDYKLIFGLGQKIIDSLYVIWPGDKVTFLKNPQVNQLMELNEVDASSAILTEMSTKQPSPLFTGYQNPDLQFTHRENQYVDFEKDKLLFHMNSTEGPCICKGDVNNDGKDDLYLGGASGQPGQLFVQGDSGSFGNHPDQFKSAAQSEDLDCAFFDANGDGNLDLYVASGGSEFSSLSVWLNDRLYFGDGDGEFSQSEQRLPFKGFESTSTVIPFDMDDDGDQDLFVGSRSTPFYYGVPPDSYLLENSGSGVFTRIENASTKVLESLGMVTSATMADLDGNGKQELIVVGRWMPVKVFEILKNQIQDVSEKWGLENSNGWYNTVETADLNNDGRADIIVGNHGLNTRFHASVHEPLELLVSDFDNNGSYEQVISMYSNGKQYPFAQLKELASQIPSVAQMFTSFRDYQTVETSTVFPQESMTKGYRFQTFNLASGIYINNGKELRFEKLPIKAQFAPVYALKTDDFDGDGNMDLIMGGNFSESKPEVGTYQASYGVTLKGDGQGHFQFVPNIEAGFRMDGDARDVEVIQIDNKRILIFTRNNRENYLLSYNVR